MLNSLLSKLLGPIGQRLKILLTTCLLPHTCILCGTSSKRPLDLCWDCQGDLPWITHPCACCAIPLPDNSEHNALCGNCLRQAPIFQKVTALFTYTKPIDRLITDLKFKGRLLYARVLGELLAEKLAQLYQVEQLPTLIIPVPLHPSRLRERGFNQALEVARPVSKRLAIAIDYNTCRRIRPTAAQACLPASQRLKNIKNAFHLRTVLTAKHVGLIDDVMTTGHTVNELSRTLKRAGVKRISVWCCARTP